MQRRDVLKLLAGAAIAPAFQLAAAEPGAPLFFSKDEFATLDELTEMIVPADDHSPGARGAGVAAFIDKTVAEMFLSSDKDAWKNGLAPYMPLDKPQRLKMLTQASANAMHPQTDAEKFFGHLKEATAFAYYTSDIGIHKDMDYVGNVVQQEFTGYECVGPAL